MRTIQKISLAAILLSAVIFPVKAADVLIRTPLFNEVKCTLDGIINEPFWSKAADLGPMYKFRSNERSPFKTELRICADKENLYLGFVCHEPSKVFVDTKAFPRGGKSDSLDFLIASNYPEREWFKQIILYTNGAIYNEFIVQPQYRYKIHIAEKFWSAEVIISKAALGPMTNSLRFNILRNRYSRGYHSWQQIFWSHDTDKFGVLEFHTPADTVTHGPWNFEITSNHAGIAWETSGTMQTVIYYRKQGDSNFKTAFGNLAGGIPRRNIKLHQISLNNLLPDTVYEYHTGDGKIHTFRTLCNKSGDFTFAATSDLHGRSEAFTQLLNTPEVRNSDMLFALGDLVTAIPGRDICYSGFLDALVKNYQGKPTFFLRGNHEFRGMATGAFFDLFTAGKDKNYYAFTHKGVCFVMLDTDGDSACLDDYLAKQEAWLKQVMNSDEFNNADFRILLTHAPIFYKRSGSQTYELLNRIGFKQASKFDLMLSGHLHRYIKFIPDGKQGGTVHFTKPLPLRKKLPQFMQLTNVNCGAIVAERKGNTLFIKALDHTGKVIDQDKITRR